MKIQSTQSNLAFGNQYAIYEGTLRKGLSSRPLGNTIRDNIGAIRKTIFEPINKLPGEGLFVFKEVNVGGDKFTLSGAYIQGLGKVQCQEPKK